jgi:ribosomal-protein-alanine N-acetyltransferase
VLPIVLSTPSPKDHEKLGQLGFESWQNSAIGRDDRGRADRVALLVEFTRFCRDQADALIVATVAGRPVGWGARENHDHIVSDLWVSPLEQGQGVGAALLNALEMGIAKDGFTQAELETYAGNAGAIRFYQRQGYSMVWQGETWSASLNYALDKVRLIKRLETQS